MFKYSFIGIIIFQMFGCGYINHQIGCSMVNVSSYGSFEELEINSTFNNFKSEIDSLFLVYPDLSPKSNSITDKIVLHSSFEQKEYLIFIKSKNVFIRFNVGSLGKRLKLDIVRKIVLVKTDEIEDINNLHNDIEIQSGNMSDYNSIQVYDPCDLKYSENEELIKLFKDEVLKKLNIKYKAWHT